MRFAFSPEIHDAMLRIILKPRPSVISATSYPRFCYFSGLMERSCFYWDIYFLWDVYTILSSFLIYYTGKVAECLFVPLLFCCVKLTRCGSDFQCLLFPAPSTPCWWTLWMLLSRRGQKGRSSLRLVKSWTPNRFHLKFRVDLFLERWPPGGLKRRSLTHTYCHIGWKIITIYCNWFCSPDFLHISP